jgi:hypothetical protein
MYSGSLFSLAYIYCINGLLCQTELLTSRVRIHLTLLSPCFGPPFYLCSTMTFALRGCINILLTTLKEQVSFLDIGRLVPPRENRVRHSSLQGVSLNTPSPNSTSFTLQTTKSELGCGTFRDLSLEKFAITPRSSMPRESRRSFPLLTDARQTNRETASLSSCARPCLGGAPYGVPPSEGTEPETSLNPTPHPRMRLKSELQWFMWWVTNTRASPRPCPI